MNKCFAYACLAVAVVVVGAANCRAQTVANGSFEEGLSPGISTQIDAPNSTSIFGWTVTSGNVDYIGTRWAAGHGFRCVDLNGVTAGAISQTISGFVPGQQYDLSFLLAANPEVSGTRTLRASIGNVMQDFSFDSSGHTVNDLGWVTRTMSFVAPSSTLTLSFMSLSGGFGGPALDAVLITPVPEPAVVLFLPLVGLAIAVARRRLECHTSGRPD